MKKSLPFQVVLATILIPYICLAQAPSAINYQGVARYSNGLNISNKNISLRISITDSGSVSPVIYRETHNTSTGINGLFNIAIGTGISDIGAFNTINWGNSTAKWTCIEMDTAGNSAYEYVGCQQLLSVPYALYAEKSGSTITTNKNFNELSGTSSTSMNYWEALEYCSGLTTNGFTDWRLPSLEEIENHIIANGIPSSGFNTWTTTTSFESSLVKVVVLISNATTGNASTISDQNSHITQCVR